MQVTLKQLSELAEKGHTDVTYDTVVGLMRIDGTSYTTEDDYHYIVTRLISGAVSDVIVRRALGIEA